MSVSRFVSNNLLSSQGKCWGKMWGDSVIHHYHVHYSTKGLWNTFRMKTCWQDVRPQWRSRLKKRHVNGQITFRRLLNSLCSRWNKLSSDSPGAWRSHCNHCIWHDSHLCSAVAAHSWKTSAAWKYTKKILWLFVDLLISICVQNLPLNALWDWYHIPPIVHPH